MREQIPDIERMSYEERFRVLLDLIYVQGEEIEQLRSEVERLRSRIGKEE